jgi:hypothetical protein
MHAPAPGADGHGKKLPHRFFNRQSAFDNPVGSAPFPLPPGWACTSANPPLMPKGEPGGLPYQGSVWVVYEDTVRRLDVRY